MVRGAKNQYFIVAEVSFSNSGFRTEGWGGVGLKRKEMMDKDGIERKEAFV